jgi:hypothetical protein
MSDQTTRQTTLDASRARPRGAGLRVSWNAAGRVLLAFYEQKMGRLTPLVIVLLVIAAILSMLALAGPITPFLYPLF